ncbi:MAG: NADH-quinone oxidoreductase subunit N [Acidobacteriota bacterium]
MLLFQGLGFPTWRDTMILAPEIMLTFFACVVLIIDVMLPRAKKVFSAYVSLIGILFTGLSLLLIYRQYRDFFPRLAFYDMYIVDGFSLVFKVIFLLGAALAIAIAIKYLDIEGEQHGEYYSLILFSTVGMMFMASGYDLLTLYISLELMAISVYILVGYLKRNQKSNEAAMKYFLLGAFSSGILLYGISLIYGITGNTNLKLIADAIPAIVSGSGGDARALLILATVLLSAGLLFKIAAVPFHMWAPDAYEGAPTSVTAFMSVGVKTASYALLARIFLEALPGVRTVGELPGWAALLGVVSALTMTFGNIAAVTQNNTKRLLAYSSISHAGYILLGIIAGNQMGYVGVVIYLLVYTVMNLGAFGVIISLRRKEVIGEHIDDLNGLIKKSPWMAVMMLIFLLSLAGFPPTAGFIGKYFLFGSLIKTGNIWYTRLAVLAILNTVVSFYYYARFIRAMFTHELDEERPISASPSLQVALGVAVVLTLLIGIYPQPFIQFSELAVQQIAPYIPTPAAGGGTAIGQ